MGMLRTTGAVYISAKAEPKTQVRASIPHLPNPDPSKKEILVRNSNGTQTMHLFFLKCNVVTSDYSGRREGLSPRI